MELSANLAAGTSRLALFIIKPLEAALSMLDAALINFFRLNALIAVHGLILSCSFLFNVKFNV